MRTPSGPAADKADPAKLEEKRGVMRIASERCTGCLECQMICSLTYQGSVNPAAAHILVSRDIHDYRYRISFTSGCRKGCHLCANHCPYGCLAPISKEVTDLG